MTLAPADIASVKLQPLQSLAWIFASYRVKGVLTLRRREQAKECAVASMARLYGDRIRKRPDGSGLSVFSKSSKCGALQLRLQLFFLGSEGAGDKQLFVSINTESRQSTRGLRRAGTEEAALQIAVLTIAAQRRVAIGLRQP